MRAKEFISEDRQKLDEIAPLAVGLYLATAGLTAYEMKSIYDDYKSGKITGKEALVRAGIQGAATVAGGVAGKVISKVPAAGAAVGAGLKKGKDFVKKQSKGSLTPAGALAGTVGGSAAIDAFDKLNKGFDDWEKNRNAANTAGANSYVYTGDKKDPPKSDFVAKNLDLERLKVKK